MTTVLLLHGPNLNLLGAREPQIYGTDTLEDYVAFATSVADKYGLEIEAHQSNHEGELIDHIHAARGRVRRGQIGDVRIERDAVGRARDERGRNHIHARGAVGDRVRRRQGDQVRGARRQRADRERHDRR